ncbi:bifunctional folylpolyglutamate synthase/dihydrofolate synthase [Truepera radiovictrix]|uniref:tetrahydrofolate synthase n=1 Tax=Truepera radiovictrix (strain DSM 17093 / CIP 108686 / LMG 22925 / RQ-24) TaxID=649638 RepID=D7CXI2_TRURR|nr:folylpolyglutamate synthase/dihydrofolate synthase family protein [Truepera radiovictrix]ADI14584.1 FolC bifunctional protein [Truepera radiovictrix DSM 17093]WMT56866.1 folylpolyglutamate synthase/dihydrofolate synthase family protein [Truepera radiovictrix]
MRASKDPELQGALDWLFARQRFGVQLGLERMRALLAALDHPEGAFESLLVGGTNGKGSVTSTLASILHAAGRPVGRFTSPHLTHFRERFTLAGEPVGEAPLLRALKDVRPHAERLGATFFEITTAVALLLFARAGVTVAVMEVGLGGRLDATNALSPRLSVITGVALDHTEVLGGTVAEIAIEKAGILRPGRLALTGAAGEALAVIAREAARLGAPLWRLGHEISVTARDEGWRGSSLTVGTPAGALAVRTPLIGAHQVPNTALAVAAARALEVPDAAIVRGVAGVRWPGRLEPVPYRGRTVLLDGAHNPAAAAALAATLERLGVAPALLVFGTSADKDAREMVRALAGSVRATIATRARLSPRSSPPETLAALWRDAARPAQVAPTPEAALALALESSQPGETVVVAGSLYLVGEVRPLLVGEAGEGWERLQ